MSYQSINEGQRIDVARSSLTARVTSSLVDLILLLMRERALRTGGAQVSPHDSLS